MKKKVLLLGNHGFVIYNFRKELIQRLLSEGYDVYISLPYDEKVDIMVNWGCKFINTQIDRRGMNPIVDLRLFVFYIKVLKEIKPDVVLTYTIKPNLYGGFACRLLKIPCINNVTGLGSGFNKNKILRTLLSIMYKISLKESKCVFFQNKVDMQTLVGRRIVTGHYELIPGSGVNLQEFTYKEYPEEDPLTFIFVGRIMKDKGIDEYLEAAKIIKNKYPFTQFNIVGFVENTQPQYYEIIKEFQNKGYINYYGYQTDVRPFLEMAHCLIQPSHGGEGLSNVLLEAAAIGRVLIASNIPGCRETIDENINGYTFKPKSTNSLVEAIEKFINLSYKDKKKMGFFSRKKVENEFNREIVVNAYMEKIMNL